LTHPINFVIKLETKKFCKIIPLNSGATF